MSPVNEWINKMNTLCNAILFSNKRSEFFTHNTAQMDQKHYAKWKNSRIPQINDPIYLWPNKAKKKKKSRDITLPTKVCLVKAMVFPVAMYGCESWTVKKAEHWRIDVYELWYWRRLFRVPWTARRSNQSILKEIRTECSLEGLMLKLNSNTLATWCEELTHWKRPWCC